MGIFICLGIGFILGVVCVIGGEVISNSINNIIKEDENEQ